MDNKSYELAQALMKLFFLLKPNNRALDIKPTEMMVLICILKHNENNPNIPIKPSDICNKLGFSKSSLTLILNVLEEKKYIYRKLSDKDRRNIYLTITQIGKEKIDSCHEYVTNKLINLSKTLSEDDLDKFIELLNKTYNYISIQKGNI